MELKQGDVFAKRFDVQERIGDGAFGIVYRVVQRSTKACRALKVIRREYKGVEAQEKRFEAEAEFASRIKSDHVVEIVDAGNTPCSWIAMELIDGETLADRVDRARPIPSDEVLTLLAQLHAGIAAAHALEIVHRDLKPRNILIARATHHSVPFTVKIIDFGVARGVGAADLTKGALGSALWMAREQLRSATPSQIGPPADIWAYGLIAFYVLVGRSFWRKDEEGALMREVDKGPQVRASFRASELGTQLPRGFDAWFARSLSREPNDRFKTIQVSFEELSKVLKSQDALSVDISRYDASDVSPVSTGATEPAGAAGYDEPQPVEPARSLAPPRPSLDQLLQDAAVDTPTLVTPAHLLGALSRYWLVGFAFYELTGPAYVDFLVDLRRRLTVPERQAGTDRTAAVMLGTKAKEIVEKARRLAQSGVDADLALLRQVCRDETTECNDILRALAQGPNSTDQLLAGAERWVEAGTPRPEIVLLPDGRFDSRLLLPALKSATDRPTSAIEPGSLGPWDILVSLQHADGIARKYWRDAQLPELGPRRWSVGSELWWFWLNAETRTMMTEDVQMSLVARELKETVLLRKLKSRVQWDALPAASRAVLESSGLQSNAWKRHLDALIRATF